MSEEINKQLLELAVQIAFSGYTPENKGVFKDYDKEMSTRTPLNIKAIYEELKSLLV